MTGRCLVGVAALGAAGIACAFRESINYLHNNVKVENGNAINNHNSNSNKVHQFIPTLKQDLSVKNMSLKSFSFQPFAVAAGSVTALFIAARRAMISVTYLLKLYIIFNK